MSYIIRVVDGSPGHSDPSPLAEFSTFTQLFRGKRALQDQLRSCSWAEQHPLGQSQFWPLVKVISVLARGCSDCIKFYFPRVNLQRTNTTSISYFFKSALEIITKRQHNYWSVLCLMAEPLSIWDKAALCCLPRSVMKPLNSSAPPFDLQHLLRYLPASGSGHFTALTLARGISQLPQHSSLKYLSSECCVLLYLLLINT